jgi:hypothetical protein
MVSERAWFLASLAFGRLLRSGRYATTRVLDSEVRKQRLFHAPLLIWLGGPLMKLLDTGVRVLPRRDWLEREQTMWAGAARTDHRELVLPRLPGRTLASWLEDDSARSDAIRLAATSLAALHRTGFTHGDAMAENVMVDLDGGTARWFDFETVHDERRPLTWRRADDLRALLATTLLRTPPAGYAAVIRLVLDGYGDDEVGAMLAAGFTSVWRRPLPFHLGQAALPFQRYHEIGRLLGAR